MGLRDVKRCTSSNRPVTRQAAIQTRTLSPGFESVNSMLSQVESVKTKVKVMDGLSLLASRKLDFDSRWALLLYYTLPYRVLSTQ